MTKEQTRGVIAIIIGFIITVLAGTTLSFLATNMLSTTQVIFAALVVFLIVSPLFAYGIYSYAKQAETLSYQTNEEMITPRQVLDVLHDRKRADVLALAQELNTSARAIHDAIEDLSQLDLFSGIANWEDGVIEIVTANELRGLERCRQCQQSLNPQGGKTICPQCGTVYYVNT